MRPCPAVKEPLRPRSLLCGEHDITARVSPTQSPPDNNRASESIREQEPCGREGPDVFNPHTVLLLYQGLVERRLGSYGGWRRLCCLAVLAGTSPGGSHSCS